MGCNIAGSIALTCSDQQSAAGVNRRVWLFNIEELADTKYTIDGSGYVTAIGFETYKGLYTFTGSKNSHMFESNSVGEEGANKFFTHRGLIKIFSSNPDDDAIIEALLNANVGAIVEDNNQEFFIYGGYNGMEVTGNGGITRNTQQRNGDTSFNIQMEGEEKNLPLRVLDTDYATTKALLESYEV